METTWGTAKFGPWGPCDAALSARAGEGEREGWVDGWERKLRAVRKWDDAKRGHPGPFVARSQRACPSLAAGHLIFAGALLRPWTVEALSSRLFGTFGTVGGPAKRPKQS